MAFAQRLTLCSALFSSLASAGDLPALGSTPAPSVIKGDAETCQRLQQDFDIDLKRSSLPVATRRPSRSPS